MTLKVIVREVWAVNLAQEICLINEAIPDYTFASMDTEFPGTIYQPNVDKGSLSLMDPSDTYLFMKANVDDLNIIQLGLALSNCKGEFPSFGSREFCFVWQFNFCDFDIHNNVFNPQSILLLSQQGIDFNKNKRYGIHSSDFARAVLNSKLFPGPYGSLLTWVTFHGAYDFGFMIKILKQNFLPCDPVTFMHDVICYFGFRVYDLKYMMRFFEGFHGGLEKLAKALNVERQVGNSHQAGSDSLLTIQTFWKFKDLFDKIFEKEANATMTSSECVLYGLEVNG